MRSHISIQMTCLPLLLLLCSTLHASPAFVEPASEAPDKMESDSLELLNSHPEVKFVDGEKAGMGETVEVEDEQWR